VDTKANDGHRIADISTPNSSKRPHFLKVDDSILILWRVSIAPLIIVGSGSLTSIYWIRLTLVTTLSYHKYEIVVTVTHDQL
jgi:hypothetical protein